MSQGEALGVDPLDVELEDTAKMDEVELTAALIVAANQAESRLSLDEIDKILGLAPDSASDGG